MPRPSHRPEYYEAIIQLRPAKQKLLEFVLNEIQNSKCTISKIDELKTGIDIRVTSRQVAMTIGKRLKKRFDGKLTLSRELHGQHKQTSKLVYRVTVLFRLKE